MDHEGTIQVKLEKSNTDNSSMMAVEGEEIGYDLARALMAQSDSDEDPYFIILFSNADMTGERGEVTFDN